MTQQEALSLAANLTRLAYEFKSTDAASAAVVKRAFREKSKNDLIRTVAYLLEVVGVRDGQYGQLQDENKDLKELLKLNNISLEEAPKTDENPNKGPGADSVASGVAEAGA